MELYAIYFALLASVSAALAWHRHRQFRKPSQGEEDTLDPPSASIGKDEAHRFKLTYFSIYVLVLAADWLQGPHMYTVYKDEKQLSESVVAALFTTGFVCAGITASLVGSLADKYGRRLACLTFCVACSVSCLSVLGNDLMILFAGRAFGGLSTTLLFSVFETWMIAEYHARELSDSLLLGDMFSLSVTLSGTVAIVAGILGEAVVGYTGSKVAPFLLAIACLAAALVGICKTWRENYGVSTDTGKAPSNVYLRTLLDKRILALAVATTALEGSMYLFVFFWSPALKSSRVLSGNTELPPFGLIFSCFMAAMMSGSLLFSMFRMQNKKDTGRVLLSILALAANSLLIPVVLRAEAMTFWSFALFELCVGLYFPTMSRLKSDLVEDSVRGKVYGLMRLPLNVFVVIALGLTKEGDAYRHAVFMVSGVFLLGAFGVVHKYL